MVSRLLREAKIAERERCARIVEDWCSAENPLSAELRERKG
jgi:hypothetical protein